MAQTSRSALKPLVLTGLEAALIGLVAGGCRLVFAPPAVFSAHGSRVRRFGRLIARAGGALVQVQSDHAAAAMAAGAAMAGARPAAVVGDSMLAGAFLAGLDDLAPVLVDASGRVPLGVPHVRLVLAPHTAQTAFEVGRSIHAAAEAIQGPGLIAGLTLASGTVRPTPVAPAADGGILPIHHTGPDDPELLLLGAGPGFEACAEARDVLAGAGVAAAHLHIVQLSPFPGAIVAPALTSSRRVLVVEPGGPGTLAAWVRSHLGAEAEPFGELPWLAGQPVTAEEIIWKAREVLVL